MTDLSDDLSGLRATWRSSPEAPPPHPADYVQTLRDEAGAFDRSIRRRDRLEYAGVALVFLGFGVQIPFVPLLSRIGAGLVMLGALYIAWRLRDAQRAAPISAPDAPTVDALRVAVERVDVQIELLRRVFEWYILPLLPGGILFILGAHGRPIPALTLTGVVCAAVIGLNLWTVRKKLLPLRARLASLLSDLDHSHLAGGPEV